MTHDDQHFADGFLESIGVRACVCICEACFAVTPAESVCTCPECDCNRLPLGHEVTA